jgi:hypothetical protein
MAPFGATLPLAGAPAKDGCPCFADLAAAEVPIERIGLEAGIRPVSLARSQFFFSSTSRTCVTSP